MKTCAMKILLALILACLVGVQVMAHTLDFGDVVIIHPAIVEPAEDSKVTCAYMKIKNRSDHPEILLGASTSVAEHTSLVEFSGATRAINEIARATIPSRQTVDFKHKGWCLHMEGLKRTLYADAGTVEVQLFFANKPPLTVDFMIDSGR